MTNTYKHILVLDDENGHLTATLKGVVLDKTVVYESSMWSGIQNLEKLHHKNNFPDLIILNWEPERQDAERFLKIYQATFYPRHTTTQVILISGTPQLLRCKRAAGYPFLKTIMPRPISSNLLRQALAVA